VTVPATTHEIVIEASAPSTVLAEYEPGLTPRTEHRPFEVVEMLPRLVASMASTRHECLDQGESFNIHERLVVPWVFDPSPYEKEVVTLNRLQAQGAYRETHSRPGSGTAEIVAEGLLYWIDPALMASRRILGAEKWIYAGHEQGEIYSLNG
jgi:hypothetical protein